MKVIVDAYINRNFGDDLLIYKLVNAFPKVEFFLFADPEYLDTLSQPKNLTALPGILPEKGDFLNRTVNKVRSYFDQPKLQIQRFYDSHDFDVYLQYGGSIFMQTTKNSWINKIRDYRYTLSRFETSAILGCNFGPYTDQKFVREHRDLFGLFDLVSFRDTYSYGLFRDLSNTLCGADIGLMVNQEGNRRASNPEGYIIASPIDLSFRKGLSSFEDAYYRKFSETLVELSKRQNLDIVLLSFCENEGDTKACRIIKTSICKQLTESRVSIATHETVEGTLNVLKAANYLVGSRFHAVMMGIAFRIPTLSISYSKKTDQELSDLEFSGMQYGIPEFISSDPRTIVSSFLERPCGCGNFIHTAGRHFSAFSSLLSHG